jgi:hypothetical protein
MPSLMTAADRDAKSTSSFQLMQPTAPIDTAPHRFQFVDDGDADFGAADSVPG